MMRASTGLGLIVVLSLFACTERIIVVEAPGGGSAAGADGADPSDPSNPEKGPSPVLSNISVTGVAVFQAVKVDVMKAGAAVSATKRNAPVVANRPGLLRVYVEPGEGWSSREVTAEVRLVAGESKFPILRETKTISKASSDTDIESTFNLELSPESLPAGVTYQVVLTAEDGELVEDGVESPGRFPADGSFGDLGAEVAGKLRVVIVPLAYETDGSGRKPDLSDAQLERYKQTLMQRYPTSEVELTARDALAWTTTISRTGTGFGSVLRAIHELRQQDEVDDDVYYYGIFAPGSSMTSFCQSACVAGLSTVADEDTPFLRASVGLGFPGQEAANTMAHELGHAHGREHAPCGGADGIDRDFPYSQGQIGVWGYDIFGKTFIAPSKGRDMMGYCPNEWVSDYTFKALFERISFVNAEKHVAGAKTSYRMALVDESGALSWGGERTMSTALHGGEAKSTHFVSAGGAQLASRTSRFFRFDHLPGGLLFVPADVVGPWQSVRVDGFASALAR